MHFPVHTTDSAPEAARPILTGAGKNFGFVPNLLGKMATAPALLKAYTQLGALFDQSSFSATERQVVLLTVSAVNGCDYCVAAHTVIAGMQQVPAPVVTAVRDDAPLADPKLEALRRFTAAVVTRRGWPDATDLESFTAAGYGAQQALEVVLGVGMKTLSNYTNHIAGTPLDDAFRPAAWTRAA
jgi:uncharacterized peroxidase-related enzyme